MATTASTKYAAQKLLVLEGRIPSQGVLCSSNFHFWQQWRRSVEQAQTPWELTPLVSHLLCKRTDKRTATCTEAGRCRNSVYMAGSFRVDKRLQRSSV